MIINGLVSGEKMKELSRRENEIIELLISGYDYSDIAKSLRIPDPFAEPLLVYGTCMRMKANPSYSKFSYWLGMYKDNIANMRSKLCTDIQQSPSITLERF